jgi:hypothetical protein
MKKNTSNLLYKTLLLICLGYLPLSGFAGTTYTSNGPVIGTDWEAPGAWDVPGFPHAPDDIVIIANGHPITNLLPESTGKITVNAGGILTLNNNLTLAIDLYITGGTVNANSFTLTLTRHWINFGGTFNPGTGTVILNGTVTQVVEKNLGANPSGGIENFNNILHNGTGSMDCIGSITCAGNLTSNSGLLDADPSGNSTIAVQGNLSITGSFNQRLGTILMNGTGAQSITVLTSIHFHNLVINNTGAGIVTLNQGFNVDALTIGSPGTPNGNLNAGTASVVNVYGNWTDNGGVFTPGSLRVIMRPILASTIGRTVAAGGTETFYQLYQTAGSLTLSSNITVTNDFELLVATATMNAASYTLSILLRGWNNLGTFNPGTGTVILADGNLFKSSGTETFNNLTYTGNGILNVVSPISCTGNINCTSTGRFDASGNNSPISLQGNLFINGSFLARSGTVTFNGTSQQTISGKSIAFYNFSVTNTGGVNFSGPSYSVTNNAIFNGTGAQSFIGTSCVFKNLTSSTAAGATFNSGTYSVTNCLISSAGNLAQAGTATITIPYNAVSNTLAYIGSGNGGFSGNFIIQRYVSGRSGHFQDLCSPVTGSTLYNDWDKQMYISGIGGRSGTACCPSFYSVRTWNEPTESRTNISTDLTLTPMVGYHIFCADNAGGTNWTSKVLSNVGTPVSSSPSDPTVALSFTPGADAGDNLIGNPFAAHIDWSLLSKTNVSPTMYILHNGAYVGYSGSVDIPAGQGFLAYATGAGASISFPQTGKTNATTSTFGRVAVSNDLSLTLSSPELSDFYQEVTLHFNDKGSIGFDEDFDARFIKSPEERAPVLCMIAGDGKKLTRNAFNPYAYETLAIPLKASVGINGTYTLATVGANLLKEYSCALLEDLFSHKVIDLKEQPTYSFVAKTTDSPDRFLLHLSRKNTSCENILAGAKPLGAFFSDDQVVIYSAPGGALVKFDLDQASKALVSVYDLQGRTIISEMSVDAYRETLKLNLPEDASGLYLVNVNLGGNHILTKKIFVSKQ